MSHRDSGPDWTQLGADVSEAQVAAGNGPGEPWYESVLRSTLPVLASTYQQQQLTKLNVARINQGLPPLDASAYARQYMVPAAQVQVGPTAEGQRMLLYVGLGIAGLIALKAFKVI